MAKKNKKKGNKQTRSDKKPIRPKTSFWKIDNRGLILLGILLLTFLVYSSNLGHEFVNWDDDKNFYENPLVRDINADNFAANTAKIFKTRVIGNYNPLAIWTFAIEKQVFGLDQPEKWHLTNILLHLLCVTLVFRLSFQLGLGKWGSVLLTLLFALHPLRVESVAWVTERKDVLYGFFYLAALFYYIRNKRDKKTKYTLYIIALFSLSLFSKIQAVILPMSMLCIDYYLNEKVSIKNVINKWYFFGMSLLFGVMGIVFLSEQGSLDTNEIHTGAVRLFIGSYSYVVYWMKLLVPYEMSPMYPYPHTITWPFYASMLALPITLWALWYSHKKGWKAIVFGMLFFIFNIFFLLQILGAGQGFLADRFTYIAYFGLFFIMAWAFEQALKKYPARKSVILGSVGLYMAILTFMNFQQNLIWENSDTMWSHVSQYYPNATLPYGNRANYLRDKGEFKRALADYNKTISLKDEQPEAYNSRAKLFFNLAKTQDTLLLALNDYNKAIQYDPDNGEFYVNRGATYARMGDINRAIEDMNKGIELKPNHAVGYLNRSLMYRSQGKIDLALKDIDTYLQYNPYNGDMWYEKARAMRQVGQVEGAIKAFDRAIQVNPNKGVYYYERGRTHASLGRKDLGRLDLQRAEAAGFNKVDPAFRTDVGG